jgi:hypothetical protein
MKLGLFAGCCAISEIIHTVPNNPAIWKIQNAETCGLPLLGSSISKYRKIISKTNRHISMKWFKSSSYRKLPKSRQAALWFTQPSPFSLLWWAHKLYAHCIPWWQLVDRCKVRVTNVPIAIFEAFHPMSHTASTHAGISIDNKVDQRCLHQNCSPLGVIQSWHTGEMVPHLQSYCSELWISISPQCWTHISDCRKHTAVSHVTPTLIVLIKHKPVLFFAIIQCVSPVAVGLPLQVLGWNFWKLFCLLDLDEFHYSLGIWIFHTLGFVDYKSQIF